MTGEARHWVLASNNDGKLREIRLALAGLPYEIRPQREYGIEPIEETAHTFVENALRKARHAARVSGLPAIAEDSGLCVDALGGAPGLYSARYAGPGASDADNTETLLAALATASPSERSAHFYCVIVALRAATDPEPLIAPGRWHGQIALEGRGKGGFGYDPVFFIESLACTAAELSPERKNELSHRGQALAALGRQLRDWAL